MATVVLTRPTTAGLPGTFIRGVTIPPLTTVVVDQCTCAQNMSVKWIYTLMDPVDEDVLTGEVNANHRYGNDPKWNRYGLVGDRMLHRVQVALTGSPAVGDLEMHITNNHTTNTFTVNLIRLQLLS